MCSLILGYRLEHSFVIYYGAITQRTLRVIPVWGRARVVIYDVRWKDYILYCYMLFIFFVYIVYIVILYIVYILYILLRPVLKTCSRHSSSICCFENREARKGGVDEICFQKWIWIKVINWQDVNTFLSLVSCNCYGTILRELKLKF